MKDVCLCMYHVLVRVAFDFQSEIAEKKELIKQEIKRKRE